MSKVKSLADRRLRRTRRSLRSRGKSRARLSVFRSSKHIYAQIINDSDGHTLASASTLDVELAEQGTGSDTEAASRVGTLVAKRAREAGVRDVVFDRGAYRYHGRVKALAEAAREAGLSF